MVETRTYLFITGFARSGTTLVANLLGAQPRFTVVSDSHAIPLDIAQGAGGFHVALSARDRNRALASHKVWLQGELRSSRLAPESFGTVGEFYRLTLDEIAQPDDLVVGHKVTDFGPDTPIFPRILAETDLRCVCVLRDVRDVVLSQSNRLSGSTTDPARWNAAARRLRELAGHPRLAVIRYEDLVRDPARALAHVEKLLGMPLVTDLDALTQHGQRWLENSSFHDVTRLFDARPVERWRAHIVEPVVRFAAWSCADELAQWNYAPFPEPFSWRERARFVRATAVRRTLYAARPLADSLRRLRNP